MCVCVGLVQVDQTADGKASLKLYDVGLAAMATNTLQAVCGTPTYMAPEMIRGAGCVPVYVYSSYSCHYRVAWWLSGYGVGFGTERSRVRLPASPLPSNNSGQVVHTYVPV